MNKKAGASLAAGMAVLAILSAGGLSDQTVQEEQVSPPNIVAPKPAEPTVQSNSNHKPPEPPAPEPIEPDPTPEPLAPKTPSKVPNSQSCSGNARCFSGIVNEVVDGDTIVVDGKEIRFALSSAPEFYEFQGAESTKLIDTICPVGSTALVDEDDGQTEGSYGRIIAVIYCNNRNLNSELMDSGFGYLASEFCDKSEFASSSWVQKYGCQFFDPEIPSEPEIEQNYCDPSYPDFCIPPSPPDLDCKDIPQKRFTVLPPDPHRFDGDEDGIGCESG